MGIQLSEHFTFKKLLKFFIFLLTIGSIHIILSKVSRRGSVW